MTNIRDRERGSRVREEETRTSTHFERTTRGEWTHRQEEWC